MVSKLKNNPRHIWAFFSTLSAAASTALYLLFFWGRNDAPAFIHLYSCTMLFCSWLNTYSYFYGFKFFKRNTTETLFHFLLIGSVVPLIRFCFFSESSFLLEYIFIFGIASSTALTPQFRELFRRGEFRKVYGFNIGINLALLIAAVVGIYFNSKNIIFMLSPLAILVVLYCLLYLKEARTPNDFPLAAAVFNPILIILERTLFEQKFLIIAKIEGFTLPYYLISRSVTFLGTVVFAVVIERTLANRKFKSLNHYFFSIGLVCILVSWIPTLGGNPRFVAIAGQVCLWLILFDLTTKVKIGGRIYFSALIVCFAEVISHWALLLYVENKASWILISIGTCMILLGIIDRKHQASSEAYQ